MPGVLICCGGFDFFLGGGMFLVFLVLFLVCVFFVMVDNIKWKLSLSTEGIRSVNLASLLT